MSAGRNDRIGSSLLRRVLPGEAVILMALGYLRWLGGKHGLFGTTVGIILLTLAAIAFSGALVAYFGSRLDRIDAERRAVEEELRRSSRHFELSRDMASTIGFDGVFEQLNAAWTDTLGWSQSELRSRPFVAFVHPDDRERTDREFARLTEGGMGAHFVARLATTDGGWRWIDWKATVAIEDGLFYASARDITGRKVAEEALALRERQSRQILEAAHDAFVAMDGAGDITDWNRQAETTFGWSREEAVGRELAALIIPAEYRAAHRQGLRRFLATGETSVLGKPVELTAVDCGGREFPVELTISAAHAPQGGRSFNAFLRDISVRKASESALVEKTAALERSNVELQQFAYVASHDLQEPLRKISSYVQILEEDYSDRLDDEGRECIAFAVDGALRMRQLIEDLLAVARVRVDTMSFGACDTAAIVAGVVEDLDAPIVESGAVVGVSGLPVVVGDAAQLRQVFQNLVSNAVKYRGAAAPVVRVAAEATAEGWLFSVADNGTGFAQEYAERVFGMFQRLVGRSQAAGTGIGLAIARKAVENHGGTIWAESEPGVGTTFRFTLPKGSRATGAATAMRDAA